MKSALLVLQKTPQLDQRGCRHVAAIHTEELEVYFGVTDTHGAARIEGVPAGARTVKVWRQQLGHRSKDVKVPAGETVRRGVRVCESKVSAMARGLPVSLRRRMSRVVARR